MLNGIPPCVGPDLLATLHRMGHGDELVLCDAHFPAESHHDRVIRADGLSVTTLLDGILQLLPLDSYGGAPLVMMEAVEGDTLDARVEEGVRQVLERHAPAGPVIERVERFAFYDRARRAFALVATGETAKYGNLILRKGLVEIESMPPPVSR